MHLVYTPAPHNQAVVGGCWPVCEVFLPFGTGLTRETQSESRELQAVAHLQPPPLPGPRLPEALARLPGLLYVHVVGGMEALGPTHGLPPFVPVI